jgi:hypothetical protein
MREMLALGAARVLVYLGDTLEVVNSPHGLFRVPPNATREQVVSILAKALRMGNK